MSEEALLILISLADGPKHGYAMIADIDRISGRRLGPGTLYGAIPRLERDGLIERASSDERRTVYRLTNAGSRTLAEQVDAMRRIAAAGARRLASR